MPKVTAVSPAEGGAEGEGRTCQRKRNDHAAAETPPRGGGAERYHYKGRRQKSPQALCRSVSGQITQTSPAVSGEGGRLNDKIKEHDFTVPRHSMSDRSTGGHEGRGGVNRATQTRK